MVRHLPEDRLQGKISTYDEEKIILYGVSSVQQKNGTYFCCNR